MVLKVEGTPGLSNGLILELRYGTEALRRTFFIWKKSMYGRGVEQAYEGFKPVIGAQEVQGYGPRVMF